MNSQGQAEVSAKARRTLAPQSLVQFESIKEVEPPYNFVGNLHVRNLILADRHVKWRGLLARLGGWTVNHNVPRLHHRIPEEPVIVQIPILPILPRLFVPPH